MRGMTGRTLRAESGAPRESRDRARRSVRRRSRARRLLAPRRTAATSRIITAANDRGVLYGAFALLRKIALGEPIAN